MEINPVSNVASIIRFPNFTLRNSRQRVVTWQLAPSCCNQYSKLYSLPLATVIFNEIFNFKVVQIHIPIHATIELHHWKTKHVDNAHKCQGWFQQTWVCWNQPLQCRVWHWKERRCSCPVMPHTETECCILSTHAMAVVIMKLKSTTNTY